MASKPELNRREALKLIGGLAIGGLFARNLNIQAEETQAGEEIATGLTSEYNPGLGIFTEKERGEFLSERECFELAFRWDKIADSLPPLEFEVTQERLVELAHEAAPFLAIPGGGLGGAFDRFKVPPSEEIQLTYYPYSGHHFHVLGSTNCRNYVNVNARFENSFSPWFRDVSVISTLVHELVHYNQGAELCRQANVERTAQVVTLEILAGLTRSGSVPAFYALADELRGMSLSALYHYSLLDHTGVQLENTRFSAMRRHFSAGALSEANYARTVDRWRWDKTQLQYILREYNLQPLSLVTGAIIGNGYISGLALPPMSETAPYHRTSDDEKLPRSFLVSHLHYVFPQAEEIAQVIIDRG